MASSRAPIPKETLPESHDVSSGLAIVPVMQSADPGLGDTDAAVSDFVGGHRVDGEGRGSPGPVNDGISGSRGWRAG